MIARQAATPEKRLGVTEPKQDRSRRSFEQVRRAVLELLAERSDGNLSIAEVSKRAGVSVGAIYGRVSGKADLLRVVQAEEYDLVEDDMRCKLEAAQGEPLTGSTADRLSAVIRAFATGLRENAPVLTPFFVLSMHDRALRERGISSSKLNERRFVDAMQTALEGSDRTVERRDLVWTYEVVFSTLVRHIDFGWTNTEFLEEVYDWDELLDRLCDTALRFLRVA